VLGGINFKELRRTESSISVDSGCTVVVSYLQIIQKNEYKQQGLIKFFKTIVLNACLYLLFTIFIGSAFFPISRPITDTAN